MPCKPGFAGSIPGFSIKKTAFGEPLGVHDIKPTHYLEPARWNWFIPRKATKKKKKKKRRPFCSSGWVRQTSGGSCSKSQNNNRFHQGRVALNKSCVLSTIFGTLVNITEEQSGLFWKQHLKVGLDARCFRTIKQPSASAQFDQRLLKSTVVALDPK